MAGSHDPEVRAERLGSCWSFWTSCLSSSVLDLRGAADHLLGPLNTIIHHVRKSGFILLLHYFKTTLSAN